MKTRNKKKLMGMLSLSILIGILIIVYTCVRFYEIPKYVRNATTEVANKMSSSFGESKCEAFLEQVSQWKLKCYSEDNGLRLVFSVYPNANSGYLVSNDFYLVALNKGAAIARNQSPDEGLMSYLKIHIE